MKNKTKAAVTGIDYFGLPPEEGFTYAVYLCPATGFSFISNKGEKMFSPKSGSEASFVNDVPFADVQALNPSTIAVCSTCNSPLSTNVNPDEVKGWGSVYCPQCSSAIDVNDINVQGEPEPEAAAQNDNPPQLDDAMPMPQENVEPVASAELIQAATAEDVVLTLHGEKGTNPFWNVIVAGVPAARIALADQDAPEDVKELFLSEQYPKYVKEACAKFGVEETLKSVNAKMYAYDVSDIAKQVEARVREQLEAEVKAQQMKLRDEFKECVAMVIAGVNKNFFRDLDNPIKAALYQEFVKAGVENPVRHIEAAFQDAADEFFDIVLAKALEYMDKPKEVRAEIAQAIGEAGHIDVSDKAAVASTQDVLGETPRSVRAKLAAGNFMIKADPAKQIADTKSVGDLKEAFRGMFRK